MTGVGGGAEGRDVVGVWGGELVGEEEPEEAAAASSSQESATWVEGWDLEIEFDVLRLGDGARESFWREDSRAARGKLV